MGKIFRQQLNALNSKNWLIYKRNICVILGELILPLVMMTFIVSIRRATKPTFIQPQTYEGQGFYADNKYTDENHHFKSSAFDCYKNEAIGIIGDDQDDILKETLQQLYNTSSSKEEGATTYNTIHFKDLSEFYAYIRQYKNVEIVPNITQL